MNSTNLEAIFRHEADNARRRGDTRIGWTLLNLADALQKEAKHGAKEAEDEGDQAAEDNEAEDAGEGRRYDKPDARAQDFSKETSPRNEGEN